MANFKKTYEELLKCCNTLKRRSPISQEEQFYADCIAYALSDYEKAHAIQKASVELIY